jgi:hypothetical protein
MTANIRNPHVQTLFTLAQADESSLQFALPDHIFGFHAQQTCEKLLKALISSLHRKYPFTHKPSDLFTLFSGIGEIIPATPYQIENLDPYAVEFRYNFGTPLTDEGRLQIRKSLAIVRNHTLTRILALESASPTQPGL